MHNKISNTILLNTTMCNSEFSCISSEHCRDTPMCEMDYADGENILFLKTRASKSCPYRLPFGNQQLCTCPVHYALMKKPVHR